MTETPLQLPEYQQRRNLAAVIGEMEDHLNEIGERRVPVIIAFIHSIFEYTVNPLTREPMIKCPTIDQVVSRYIQYLNSFRHDPLIPGAQVEELLMIQDFLAMTKAVQASTDANAAFNLMLPFASPDTTDFPAAYSFFKMGNVDKDLARFILKYLVDRETTQAPMDNFEFFAWIIKT